MVEGARLESVYSGNAIAGSNPALSATRLSKRLLSKGSSFLESFTNRPENCKKAKLRFMYAVQQNLTRRSDASLYVMKHFLL